jgi:hypothetical protein
MDLRVLSVRQPWPSLILAGLKRFELRSWPPNAEGPYLLHASASKADGISELRADPDFQKYLKKAKLTDESGWVQSAIIGLFEVSQVIEPGEGLPNDYSEIDEVICGNADDVFYWRIGSKWTFPKPIPCPGKLNLWRPDSKLSTKINTQLEAIGVSYRIGKTSSGTRSATPTTRSTTSRSAATKSKPTKTRATTPKNSNDDADRYFDVINQMVRGRK